MPLRRLVIVCGLLAAVACKDDDPPAAEPTPEAKQQQECERFATEMARTGLIAGQILVTALDDDPDSASRGRDGMKSTAQALRRELFDKCLTWPEDVMACLPPLGILKDGCDEKLLAAMDGGTPAPEDVPPGLAAAWSVSLSSAPRHLAMTSDGTVLVVGEALEAIRDGKTVWRKDGRFDDWLLRLPGERSTWVAGIEDRLVAFDPADGSERWVATLPAIVDDEASDEPDSDDAPIEEIDALASKAKLEVAALHGEALLVGDAAARFFRVDPARCATASKAASKTQPKPKPKPGVSGCVSPAGQLPDEVLEDEARLLVGADGERFLWETGVVRAFAGDVDGDWSAQMAARAHDLLSHATVADGRLVLIVDHDVVELDPAACRSEAAFAPSGWPQPGALVMRGYDECEDCAAAPTGCRRWRVYLDDVTGEAPAVLQDGAVVVHDDGYTLALAQGTPRWKVTTGGGGPLATDGTRILGFSTGLREGDAPGVFELDPATGSTRWRTPLTVSVGEIYSSDDIRLALAGAWLAVTYESTLTLVPLPPA